MGRKKNKQKTAAEVAETNVEVDKQKEEVMQEETVTQKEVKVPASPIAESGVASPKQRKKSPKVESKEEKKPEEKPEEKSEIKEEAKPKESPKVKSKEEVPEEKKPEEKSEAKEEAKPEEKAPESHSVVDTIKENVLETAETFKTKVSEEVALMTEPLHIATDKILETVKAISHSEEEKEEVKSEKEEEEESKEKKEDSKSEEPIPESAPTTIKHEEEQSKKAPTRQDLMKFLNNQSQETDQKPIPGQGLPRRNARYPQLMSTLDPSILTLHDILKRTVSKLPKNTAFGTRTSPRVPYDWINYEEFYNRVLVFGSGLYSLGHKRQDHIGIMSKNRLEWLIVEQSCSAYALVSVALYETYGKDNIAYAIDHSDLSTVICSSDKLETILELKYKALKRIVCMDEFDEDMVDIAREKKIELIKFADVESLGKKSPVDPPGAKPEDVATIMYTSGTTGVPKGVIHTHSSMVAGFAGLMTCYNDLPPSEIYEVYISYLPLAHILERIATIAMIYLGGAIAFSDPKRLMRDIKSVRPTILAGVPRVFERMKKGIYDNMGKGFFIKGKLFNLGLSTKKSHLQPFESTKSPWYSKFLFDKLKSEFGGRIRLLLVGASALSPDTHDFLRACFDCPVLQGYGLTETACAATMQNVYDLANENVGGPVPSCEIKLVDFEKYKSENDPPQGEIYIRGPILSRGYYKDEEKTKEDFDEDGWFHTGDIGEWEKNGTLKIVDRKKNLIKLAQGEYISVEKLEKEYEKSDHVNQICVHGDSDKDSLIAIVHPKKKTDEKQLLSEFEKIWKNSGMNPLEKISAVVIAKEEFKEENEMATNNGKLKRSVIKEKYKKEIEEAYAGKSGKRKSKKSSKSEE